MSSNKTVSSAVSHLSTLSSANLAPANQFGVTAATLRDIAATVPRTGRQDDGAPVKNDPKKVATIRTTIAYVLDSVRIQDKSEINVARKCAIALNKAAVPAERKGEPVWTAAATLAEIGRLHAAGLLTQ